MKKILVILFLFVFELCLVGCDANNKPTIEMLYGNWYNCSKLPSMENPFAEAYDGSYTIRIDKNNNVIFNTFNEEKLNGKLQIEEMNNTINIEINFENGNKAKGYLSTINDKPYLSFFYEGYNYSFTYYKSISKDEFMSYRNNFNAFLRNSFENDNYPTIEEVEINTLYREYTNYAHIDPCCNGPKIYTSVNKVTITNDTENGVAHVTYNDGKIEYINIYDIDKIVLVKKDGTFERLDNILDGQCFWASNYSLYYFESDKVDINITADVMNIKDAYEFNKINKEQLQEIADILNGYKTPNQNTEDGHLLAIKVNALEELKKSYDEATLADINVNIYWRNGSSYVIKINDSFTEYPAVEDEITIDGITITYSGPKPMFVVITNE